jgi:hypothetical protein
MSIPRNNPCPCGSGRKFKKCCGGAVADILPLDPFVAQANAVKRTDMELHELLVKYAQQRVGGEWLRESVEMFLNGAPEADLPAEMELAIPWVLFHCPAFEDETPIAGRLGLDWRSRLTRAQHEMVIAQLHTRLSIWEATAIEPGVGMALHDLLTGASTFVYEVRASQTVPVGSALLARVVEIDEVAFIAGVHGRVLAPSYADMAVVAMRRECRVRTRPIKPERLMDPDRQLILVDIWRSFVALADRPPALSNTDGDPLTFITDRFDFAPARRAAVLRQLATIDGAGEVEAEGDTAELVVTRPSARSDSLGFDPIIGRVEVRRAHLLIETNSTIRADLLQRDVAAALGDAARFRLRSEQNMPAMLEEARMSDAQSHATSEAEPTPEMHEALRQFREQYMQRWLDDTIPALGGLTPRQAAADPAHHPALRRLLKDMEFHERRLPKAQQCDTARLRAQLGM